MSDRPSTIPAQSGCKNDMAEMKTDISLILLVFSKGDHETRSKRKLEADGARTYISFIKGRAH